MTERGEQQRHRGRATPDGQVDAAPAAPAPGVGARGTLGRAVGQPPPGRRSALPEAPDRYRYSIAELEEQTGINARTIRYYIGKGLLAPAYGRGPTATYDLGHLLRLRMIRHLQEVERLPLAEIKERLGRLSDEAIETLLGVETRPAEDRWRRIALHPDIELHVRDRGQNPRGDQAFEDAVELIVGLARPVIDRLEGPR